MAKLGQDKINELIGEMGHYDPDNMEMAAKRISEMILAKEIDLEANPALANNIREAFMKQIESENDTVQSEAIKYLADIVPSLPSEQVEIIYQKILEHITHLEESEKKRERYGACAATVIHQAAEEYGTKLGNLFLKSVENLLRFQDRKVQLEIILINIITEFIRKWPNVASRLKYDRKGLLVYLLRNVQLKNKLQIIKRSESCIGKLALILDKELMNVALNDKDWGLLRFVNRNSESKSPQGLKHARNGLLCISQLLKSHNIELRFWARETAHLLLNVVNQYKQSDDIDNIEVICDILQAGLTALSFVVRTFSRELREEMSRKNSPYIGFLKALIDFNVEGMMSYAGEQIQEQGYDDYDGYYEQAEADQKCWKVRRAALNYFSYLARYDKQFLESLQEGEFIEDLGSKLIEEHSMVSEMAFNTFNELIELISIDRALTNDEVAVEEMSLQRVKSSAKDIADRIIKELTDRVRIIMKNSKFNDQLKAESCKILLRLVQIYHQHLLSSESETFGLVSFLFEQLRKINIDECRVNLLGSLKELLSIDYGFDRYRSVLEYCFETLSKGASIKLQVCCILTIRKFLDIFHQTLKSEGKYLEKALSLLRAKVEELDSDKTIKTAVCRSLGVLFKNYNLSSKDLVLFLNVLGKKLKIQIEKIYIVETLAKLNSLEALPKEAGVALQNVIRQIAENLGSNNFELNSKSIETINKLLSVAKNSSTKLFEELLDKSRIILGEGKIPDFVAHIAGQQPKLLKPYAELIIKSTESYYIRILIQNKLIDVPNCLNILKTLDQEKAKKISETVGSINLSENDILKSVDESSWGRIMTSALGYVGSKTTLPTLYELLAKFKSEEAKKDVCYAIGNILAKNPDELVPAFIGRPCHESEVYMSLWIIKEMLGFVKVPFACFNFLVEWLFSKGETNSETESNIYIIAQCVGRIAFLSTDLVKRVISNAKAAHPSRRFIVASSLRFALQSQAGLQEEILDEYTATVVKMMGDQKVSVREGAVKSIASVGQCYTRGVRVWAHDREFWETILRNAQINDKLIIVIDYGLCKETKDEGKNLRLESFNLLHTLTKKIPMETYVIEEAMAVAIHRIVDENNYDILLKRFILLKSLCELDFSPFIRLQNEFVKSVNPKEGALRQFEKGVKEERNEIYIRGILKQIAEIDHLAREQNVDKIGELMAELRNSPFFQPMMESK